MLTGVDDRWDSGGLPCHAGSYCTLSRRWGKGWASCLTSQCGRAEPDSKTRQTYLVGFCHDLALDLNLALYLLTFCPYHTTLPSKAWVPPFRKPDLANPNIGCLVKLELQINKLGKYSYTKKVILSGIQIWNPITLCGNKTSFTSTNIYFLFPLP